MTESRAASSPPPSFQWIVEGKLAAFGFPGKPENIRWLQSVGIEHLVSLHSPPRPPINSFPDIRWTLIAVPNYQSPRINQIREFVDLVDEAMDSGKALGVHCRLGRGRTGTMLAAYFVHSEGLSADEAIAKIRSIRNRSVETRDQELVVRRYWESLQTAREQKP